MRKYITEFLGTLFLVLVVLIAIDYQVGLVVPTLIAGVLMVLIYIGAPYSKAHYNPAVSLAFFLRKDISSQQLLGYWASELLGTISAMGIYRIIGPKAQTKEWYDVQSLSIQVGFAELVATCCLVAVILAVATLKQTAGNRYYGVAIAGMVWLMIVLLGPISSAIMNPSVLIGLTMNNFELKTFSFYLGMEFLAAIGVALAFNAGFGSANE
ncbi:MAG: aquaporin [Saprospiraceae bacterium]|nr:aquaporin [Saprospiraceae bacterium]